MACIMVKPWHTLATSRIHADRWIDLRADTCRTPGGTEIAPYYVLTYPDWVHVVALTADGGIVLMEQYRHGAATVCLELPGGAVDATDLDPVAAARRELREETGFAAAAWQPVCSLYANPAIQTNRIHTVLATGCTRVGDPTLEDGEEGLAVCVRRVAEVRAGLRFGLLGQSMQVAGLLLALEAAGLTAEPRSALR